MSTTIEQILDGIGQFNFSFLEKIRGATPQEIDQLEHLAGTRLPDIYRSFLAYMGKDMGGLNVYDLNFHIGCIIETLQSNKWRPPNHYILIAKDKAEPYYDAYLDTTSSGDEPVFRFPTRYGPHTLDTLLKQGLDVLELSLTGVLFRFSFLQFYLPQFPEKIKSSIVQTESIPRKSIEDLLMRMEFTLHPLSSGWCAYYTKSDAICYLRQPPGYSVEAKIAGRNYKELHRIKAVFEQNLGFRMVKE